MNVINYGVSNPFSQRPRMDLGKKTKDCHIMKANFMLW